MRNSTKVLTIFLLSCLIIHGKIRSQATCATAIMLNTGPTCSTISGTLLSGNATAQAAACSANPTTSPDAWYKFVAESTFPTVTLSNIGSNFNTAGPRIQILSGACGGSQTVRACSNTLIATPATALTLGTTYYIRVLTNTQTTSPATGNWGFDICVTNPPVVASRMNEIFKETTLYGSVDDVLGSPYPALNLNNPWEITYGSDGNLWVTEGKGYTIRRIDPTTGVSTTMVDLSMGASGWLTAAEHTTFNRQFASGFTPWPQGGMMGLAVHPQFKDSANKKFVYVGYVHSASGGSAGPGYLFTTKIVRFEYDTVNNKLYRPVSLCDTIRGSDDHNSGRMIIAPVDGVNYLFYALGDMGTGNYNNKTRTNKSQNPNSYEGKILRFNLEPDSDADLFDRWIPDSTGNHNNPFNGATQNAVYTIGVRNNQGFAYNPITNKLYGSEHGMFADDEINILERGKNYGHPLVEGYADGNYNGAKPGSSSGTSYSIIANEVTNATTVIGADFRGPLYSLYPAPNGPAGTPNTILNIYGSTTGDPASNANTSIAQSGLDIYYSSFIPGWKNSLLTASMKKAKIFRLKLNATGDLVVPTPAGSATPLNDTVGLFWSLNRYRDIAISPDGRTIFASIDRDQTTSGPTSGSPQPSLCPGCIKKFEFLGYADNAGVSTIPTSIPVGTGASNTVTSLTTTLINSDNNNIWVPITDSNGDIIAEIDANGNNLDTITSSIYISSTIRTTAAGNPYLNRSITITPKNQPAAGTPVNVRFYLKAAELASLMGAPGSNVTGLTDVNIFKNNDANSSVMTNSPILVMPTTRANFSTDHVITASIDAFSSFYFAAANLTVLPLDLLSFTGRLQNDNSVLLNWKTENEINTSHFVLERSADGIRYSGIGNVTANGRNNAGGSFNYTFTDNDAVSQSSQKLFYRLRMVDIDGTYKYSHIVTISLPLTTGKLSISPNPVLNEMKVTIASPDHGKVQWKLMDNVGRIMLKGTEQVKKGDGNNFTINMNRLSAGTYYLSVKGAGNDQDVKIQKL